MKQYFYLVVHVFNEKMEVNKIFLQEYDAIKFGRRIATINSEYKVWLYRQSITRNGVLTPVKQLKPYENN